MQKINEYFNDEQLSLLHSIGVDFDSEKDYSDDELFNIHDIITDNYLTKGFDKKSNPTSISKVYEEIIDVFYDKLSI